MRVLDNLLVQLASSVDTDIMPGEFDPANQILPQQPLHPCLFPSEFEITTLSYILVGCQHNFGIFRPLSLLNLCHLSFKLVTFLDLDPLALLCGGHV